MTHDQLQKLADKYGAYFDDEGVDTWNFDLWELHALLIAAFEQMKEKANVKN
jgi:hypothetical protein